MVQMLFKFGLSWNVAINIKICV